jgi:hypothetical protein
MIMPVLEMTSTLCFRERFSSNAYIVMQRHKNIRLKSLHELRTWLPHERHAINGDLHFAHYLATVLAFFFMESCIIVGYVLTRGRL